MLGSVSVAARTIAAAIAVAGALAFVDVTPAERGAGEVAAKHKASTAAIEKLVAQLGSPSHTARENATRALLKLGAEAAPFLKKALKSPDPEIQHRSSWILSRMSAELHRRAIQMLAPGGIDQYVERLVIKGRQVTEADWADVALVAQSAPFTGQPLRPRGVRLSMVHEGKKHSFKFHSAVADEYEGNEDSALGRGRIGAEKVIARRIKAFSAGNSFLICGDDAQITRITNCILLANGDVKSDGDVANSVIICDGQVDIRHGFGDSVVIANGPVKLGVCSASTIVAGGPVTVAICHNGEIYAGGSVTILDSADKTRICAKGAVNVEACGDCMLHSEGAVTVKADRRANTIEQNRPQRWPQVPFTFFDPARLGVHVAVTGGQLRVTGVAADKPFRRAGLKRGDIIVAMDGAKPASVDVFRKLLRRSELVGRTTLSILRDGSGLEIAVSFRPEARP